MSTLKFKIANSDSESISSGSQKTENNTKKVTLYIDKPVFSQFKMCAAHEDTTISALAEKVFSSYVEICKDKW
jgi:hypothetical protein